MSETPHALGDNHTVRWHYGDVEIRDERAEYVGLTPHQALALLSWLEQERDTLLRLAKESPFIGRQGGQ